ncbi:MAG: hypothetical protein QXL96_12140 [Ignisphaera sp.]
MGLERRYTCVESSARLHLGFYNFFEDNVAYGGLGVAIEEPRVRVCVRSSENFELVNRSGVDVSDIGEFVKERLGVEKVSISVDQAISRHIGLGSTTQISLSIAYAIAKHLNLGYTIRELAVLLGRGMDSGIGIAAFEYGGFVVDSGRRVVSGRVEKPKSIEDLPKIIFRSPLPIDWYFIVVVPRGIKGLDEKQERKAMDIPHQLPKELQYELYKLLLLNIIPSVLSKDVELFGKAITKLQLIVGTYFSKYQGGIFCCRESEEIVKTLQEHGAYGVGQSSWGPTVYGLVKSRVKALKILRKVTDKADKLGLECDYYVVRARNKGAKVYYINQKEDH